jgi:hypothetical protein
MFYKYFKSIVETIVESFLRLKSLATVSRLTRVLSLTISLGIFLFLELACGIRGAPIPPKDPNLFFNDYQEDLIKKDKENEQKNKFRRSYSPNNTVPEE